MYQTDAIAQTQDTIAQLEREADALSRKGLCQDDFEWYAQRLEEAEHHLAWLDHLAAREAEAERAQETAAYREPASCALCCAYLDGYADGTARFCSAACREGAAEDAAVERAVQRDLDRYQP